MDTRLRWGLVAFFLLVLFWKAYESQRGNTKWRPATGDQAHQHQHQPPGQNSATPTEPINAEGPMLQTIERLSLDLSDLKKGFDEDKLNRLVRDVQALQALAHASTPAGPVVPTPVTPTPATPATPSATGAAKPGDSAPATPATPTPTPPVAVKKPAGPRPYKITLKLVASGKARFAAALAALSAADFEGDTVPLDIFVDKHVAKGEAGELVAAGHAFAWPHGSRTVIEHAGGATLWPEMWNPAADARDKGEYAVFISDDVQLSPLFYRFLTAALMKYRHPEGGADAPKLDGSVYGISPARQEQVVAQKNAKSIKAALDAATQPLLYALFSDTCQLMFPEHWRAFLEWSAKRAGKSPALDNVAIPQPWVGDGKSAWAGWFLRYTFVRNLYSLYPGAAAPADKSLALPASTAPAGAAIAASASAAAADWPQLPAPAALEKFDLCGQKQRPGRLARGEDGLKSLLAERSEDNIIVAVTVNKAYQDFAYNWLCSIRALGIQNYILYTVEEDTAKAFYEEGYSVFFGSTGLAAHEQAASLDYGTPAYQKLILARTAFVNSVLQAGYTILAADVDAVWKKNPIPYLKGHIGDRNLLAQDDNPHGGHVICGGFMWLAGTQPMRDMWAEVYKQHKEIIANAERTGSLRYIDESEQVILTRLLQQKPDFKHGYLSPDYFPNGAMFFNDGREMPEAYVIHNNFVIGGDPKRDRFRQRNLWWIDNDDKHCRAVHCAPT